MKETPTGTGPAEAGKARPHRAASKSHAEIRAERLQEALRENLRRRKAAQPSDNEKAKPKAP